MQIRAFKSRAAGLSRLTGGGVENDSYERYMSNFYSTSVTVSVKTSAS